MSRIDHYTEKYYKYSYYISCCNNPINFIDYDGEEVVIWYTNKNGEDRYYRYNGKQTKIPNNQFVKDFVYTYLFLKKNGAGKCLIKAVTDSEISINVQETDNSSHAQFENRIATVFWNPNYGIITTTGGHQSPATILDHEFDHSLDAISNGWINEHNKRSKTRDLRYENKEERRVITGSERRNVKILKESIRYDHYGKMYEVISPISTNSKKRMR